MASIIKVNNVQNTAAGKNIINESGNTVTIGASGDTVTLAAGASQSGFGQTYSAVSWDTTAKTTTVTGVAGVGYFINTSGAAVTANLPAGTAGDVIAFADYTRTFQTNNLTITPNGSEKVGGVAANFVALTEGQSITLVYVDATEGWINTMDSTGQAGLLPAFITACGGTPSTSGDYKIHTFTGPGTFTVTCGGNPLGSDSVDYMVVAGGGGGANNGGAGGAGGFREGYNPGSYTASPLATTALPVSATGYPITVGAGGTSGSGYPSSSHTNGLNSVFSTITSTGGGKGSGAGGGAAGSGGSGGGGGCTSATGGAGNTPSVSPSQGFPGGDSAGPSGYGGGGGATAVGLTGSPPNAGGVGGAGATSSINTTPTARAGGGGGAGFSTPAGYPGGVGGGGKGSGPEGTGCAGTVNTGGGGGGAAGGAAGPAGAGGSGIVIIRYKFQ